jgi:hypothetical protein
MLVTEQSAVNMVYLLVCAASVDHSLDCWADWMVDERRRHWGYWTELQLVIYLAAAWILWWDERMRG